MSDSSSTRRVLAIDPTTSGFGFAVFEGPERLIDWGTREATHDKNARCLKLVSDLIDRYSPDRLLIEDTGQESSRRCRRVKRLMRSLNLMAKGKHVPTKRISRWTVRRVFSNLDATTKHQIATRISLVFPELALRLPPVRKPWMSEDDRMSIFDAAALCLTYFTIEQKRKAATKSLPTNSIHASQD